MALVVVNEVSPKNQNGEAGDAFRDKRIESTEKHSK